MHGYYFPSLIALFAGLDVPPAPRIRDLPVLRPYQMDARLTRDELRLLRYSVQLGRGERIKIHSRNMKLLLNMRAKGVVAFTNSDHTYQLTHAGWGYLNEHGY